MKTRSSLVLRLVVFLSCALSIASADRSLARAYAPDYYGGGGRLVIGFSPTLGINVGIVIEIDGRVAGALSKGHIFTADLAPAPHTLSVYRNGRNFDALHEEIYVNSGERYSFVIKYRVNEIVLQRVGRVR